MRVLIFAGGFLTGAFAMLTLVMWILSDERMQPQVDPGPIWPWENPNG